MPSFTIALLGAMTMAAGAQTERSDADPGPRWSPGERIFVLLALLLMAILAVASFYRESPVFDEVAHIPSGLSHWQQRDARLNVEHPPLMKMIAVIPLLFTNIHADYTDRSFCMSGDWNCQWLFGRKFFEEWNPHRAKQVVLLSRLPMLLLTLLLGWTIYSMARTLAGPSGAKLSLIVFVTSPFFLGYGPLVIMDIGLCLFVVLSAWTGANLWLKRYTRSLAAFTVSVAAALLVKFSALLIFPSLALFGLWMWWRPVPASSVPLGKTEQRREFPISQVRWLMVGVIGAVLIVYAFYWLTCFRSSPLAIDRARLASIETFRGPERFLQLTNNSLTAHPHWERPLLPVWLYVTGIGYLNASLSRPTYLLGAHHPHGVWYYFPVVSFYKLSPGMLGLILLLIMLTLRRRFSPANTAPLLTDANRTRLRALLCFGLVFAIAAIRSRLNIGIRHFSVPISISVIPTALLVPLVSQLSAGRLKLIMRTTIAALALSTVFTALVAFPNYISYYNWFRLSRPKQEICTDSNLDWGQSLEPVASFAAAQNIQKIYADTLMMPLAPDVYIPGAQPWRCDDPNPESPEWVVVSADFLLKQPPTCGGLMRYQHWPLASESIYVFRVTDNSYAQEAKRYRQEHPNASVNLGVFK